MWNYQTEYVVCTELETISSFFINNNKVYIVVGGKVYALHKSTGKVIWKTDSVAISAKGNILWKVSDATKGTYY